jgi:hypothetical protein
LIKRRKKNYRLRSIGYYFKTSPQGNSNPQKCPNLEKDFLTQRPNLVKKKKKLNELQQPLVIINMTQQVDKTLGKKIYHFRPTTSKRSSKENSIITY